MTGRASSLSTFFHCLTALEAEMRTVVRTTDPRQAGLFGMLHYHLGWADAAMRPGQTQAGKRVRPMLCLLACEACGGRWEQAIPAATALELMHNFTLIHDDIEDGDETRRGRPTVWALWGQAQGVNAGDALFALVQLALVRLEERGVPAPAVVAAVGLLNRTCVALTGGQYLDIGFESRDNVSMPEYLAMIEGKTAALAAGASEMGALIATAPAVRREQLRAFGYHLGMAFQMHDDVLGIWGDSAVTGKPVGADIARRKKSLPLLHGLERSAELRALLAQETLSTDDVRRATRLLEQADSRAYAEQLEGEYHAQALDALAKTGLEGPAVQALQELAEVLLHRAQ